MADNVRRIVAEFSAKNKAKGIMGGFRRDLDTTGRAMRRLATGALALAGVGGFGYMIKKTMDSIDQIAKMSDELQISTEALTGLEHAAKISGTSIESLHKGIGIFVRRMGEAKYGVGEGVRGLKMLNLTAEEMISMGTEEAFMNIAERISQAGSAAEQAGIAYNFFGRQGTQLLNMFQQGRVGIEELREEAERLGLTFSRFDAGQVEAANDALTRARATMTGLFRTATIELAPYIEVLADKFVDAATAGEGLGTNVVNAFESMSMAAIRFGGLVQTIPAYWKGVEAAAHESLAAVYDLADAATNLDVLFKKLKRPGWEKTYKELAQEQRQIAAGLMEEGGRKLAGTYGQENAIRRFYEDLRVKGAGRREAIEAGARQQAAPGLDTSLLAEQAVVMQEHYDKLKAMGGNYQEMQERMARQGIETEIAAATQRYEAEAAAAEKAKEAIIASARNQVNALRYMDYMTRMERIENLKAYVEANAGALAEVSDANEMLNDEILALERSRLDAMQVYMAELREDMQNTAKYTSEKFAQASRRIETSMGNAFYDMITGAATWRDAFKEFMQDVQRSFMRMIAEMIARQMMLIALQAISAVLTGGGSIAYGAIAGAIGGSGGGMPTAGTGTPQANATLARYQHGGLATRPHLAMVGEVPEAIVPLSDGRSIPVEMRGGTGGGGIGERPLNITFINESGTPLQQKGNAIIEGERLVVYIEAKLNERIQRNAGPLRNTFENLK